MAAEGEGRAGEGDGPIEYEAPLEKWDPKLGTPGFYDWRTTFPFLRAVLRQRSVVVEELAQLTGEAWTAWPETALYDVSATEWRVVPFAYTFPAWDATRTEWVPEACAAAPRTAALLRSIPGIRTALLSRLGPRTRLVPHSGWADLANHVLRCHMPLSVPAVEDASLLLPLDNPPDVRTCVTPGHEEGVCGVGVETAPESGTFAMQFHKEGDILIFDDSQTHFAINRHPTASRVVLIFDIARPPGLPLGKADIGHTDELDAFISKFKHGGDLRRRK
jgi:hypothetical protein